MGDKPVGTSLQRFAVQRPASITLCLCPAVQHCSLVVRCRLPLVRGLYDRKRFVCSLPSSRWDLSAPSRAEGVPRERGGVEERLSSSPPSIGLGDGRRREPTAPEMHRHRFLPTRREEHSTSNLREPAIRWCWLRRGVLGSFWKKKRSRCDTRRRHRSPTASTFPSPGQDSLSVPFPYGVPRPWPVLPLAAPAQRINGFLATAPRRLSIGTCTRLLRAVYRAWRTLNCGAEGRGTLR